MEQKKKREIKLSKGNNEKKIIKMNTMEKKKTKEKETMQNHKHFETY